jgi:hypothetical protein
MAIHSKDLAPLQNGNCTPPLCGARRGTGRMRMDCLRQESACAAAASLIQAVHGP